MITVRACACRCHSSSSSHVSCDVDAGFGVGCGPHVTQPEPVPCVIDGIADATRGLLCARHYHWIGDTLTQLEDLWALRGQVVATVSGPQYDAPRHGAPDGSPAPGRIEVMALDDPRAGNTAPSPMTYERNWNGRTLESNGEPVLDIPSMLHGWVRECLEQQLSDIAVGLDVVSSVRYLRGQRMWIARQHWVADYAVELHDAHEALAGATGAGMWPRSIGSCPNCGVRLYNTIGVDSVTCRRCKTTWTGVALARLRLIHEQDQERRKREAG